MDVARLDLATADPAAVRRVLVRSAVPDAGVRSGADQVRMSATPARAMRGAPIDGITATTEPVAGPIRNQGRVGLSQKRVRYPVK